MITPIVETTGGKLRGAEVDDGVFAWRGIPYAAAPVGRFRFRLPQPAEPWSGVRDAVAFGAPALQAQATRGLAGLLGTPPPADAAPAPAEDCLYVNVMASASARRSPVLVWIHGGGYQSGSGAAMAGEGLAFARDHGVVVVTFNYRLGALGFLSVDGEQHTGAYGLHDQIALLRWVHDNVAAFGGDPDRVTVYGVSAGGKSVANLMAAAPARGLFARAASSSGGGDHVATPEQAAAVARRFLRELGTDAERLRDVPAPDLLQAQLAVAQGSRATWLWRPVIDGLALTRRPTDAVAAGAAAGIPLLAQHCVNECELYQLLAPDAADQTDRVLETYFGVAGREEILAVYAAGGQDPTRYRIDVMTDERYGVPTARLADAQSAHAPVWRSRYDGPLTGLPAQVAPTGSLPAFHGSDARAIWAGGDGVAGQMHAVWAAFVTSGRPDAAGLPAWPEYTQDERPTMLFDSAGTRVENDPAADRRRAWEGRDWQSGTWFAVDGIDGADVIERAEGPAV